MGVINFQKIFGLYGLKHHIVEISGDVTDPDEQTTRRKHRATQLLICEKLSLAKSVTDGRIYLHLTWVGARDACASKNASTKSLPYHHPMKIMIIFRITS